MMDLEEGKRSLLMLMSLAGIGALVALSPCPDDAAVEELAAQDVASAASQPDDVSADDAAEAIEEQTPAPLSHTIVMGDRGFTLTREEFRGLDAQVRPGDYVDITAHIPGSLLDSQRTPRDGLATVTVLQRVKVLNVRTFEDEHHLTQLHDVTLGVSVEEHEMLLNVSRQSTLNLTLRNPDDVDITSIRASTLEENLQEIEVLQEVRNQTFRKNRRKKNTPRQRILIEPRHR